LSITNQEENMKKIVKDVTKSVLPLTVAYAEQSRVEKNNVTAGYYSTYTTDSGSSNSPDDSPIKDEN
jgi:hypothetical protein